MTSVDVGDVIWGTATKVWLRLDYNDQGRIQGLPSTMVLKAGLGGHEYVAAVAPLYAHEAWFFRNIAPELPLNVPACYFAGTDDRTGQGALLLEDLLARNVHFGRATSPVTSDTAAAILDMLACLHAQSWASPRLNDLDLFPGVMRSAILRLLEPEHWAACMARPRAAWVPEPLRDREVVKRAISTLWGLDEHPPHCFIHGDPHLGNIYFEPDGRPGLLDWQGSTRGNWAHDVTYFLVGSLAVPDRRALERDLIAHYLGRLAAYSAAAPSFDDAWLAYRRHIMYGFLWVANPEELQPEDVNEAEAERFSVAAVDLDTLKNLEN